MLVLSRPPLHIHLKEDISKVAFPAAALVNVTMTPTEFFGVTPLTGKLNISPIGATLQAKLTNFRGPGRLLVCGLYQRTNFTGSFLGQAFTLDGNVAAFQASLNSASDLTTLVAYIEALFPALFSGAYHAPIDIDDISGWVQGIEFTVSSSLAVSSHSLATPQELPLKEYFDTYAPQSFLPPVFLISAFRYLQQADRLSAEGSHLTSFLSERLLNLAKSLEAIFPGQVDEMRTELAGLGVDSTYIDILASVRYLRNQLDVGHVSFSGLQRETVQSVIDFATLATSCLRALLSSLLVDRASLERLERQRATRTAVKVPNAVEYLRKYAAVAPPKNGDLSVLVRKE